MKSTVSILVPCLILIVSVAVLPFTGWAAPSVTAQSLATPNPALTAKIDSLFKQINEYGFFFGDWESLVREMKTFGEEPAAMALFNRPSVRFSSDGKTSYSLACLILEDRLILSPQAIAALKRVAFTVAEYTDGHKAANVLVKTKWKPANLQERILFTLALNQPREIVSFGPEARKELVVLFQDTTFCDIRYQLLRTMRYCQAPELVECDVNALCSIEPRFIQDMFDHFDKGLFESDPSPYPPPLHYMFDSRYIKAMILAQEATRGMIETYPACKAYFPVLLDRIRKEDVTPVWLMLKDPDQAPDILEACLAIVAAKQQQRWGSGYHASLRTAIDEYAATFQKQGTLANNLRRIPDDTAKALIRLLVESRHLPLFDYEGRLTDSGLFNLVKRQTPQQEVSQSLASMQAADLAILDSMALSQLKPYLSVFTIAGASGMYCVNNASSQYFGLLDKLRLISLANRSPYLRSLIRSGQISAPDSIIVGYPWNQANFHNENWPPDIIHLQLLNP